MATRRFPALVLLSLATLAPAALAQAQTQQHPVADEARAISLRQAAEHGDLKAILALGLRAEELGDLADARQWYEKGRALKSPQATALLAYFYLDGKTGCPKDESAALALFEEAANAGDGNAMLMCGLIREAPTSIPRDDTQAATWFTKAAACNVPLAARRLGFFHIEGRGGLKKSEALAAKWLTKAAELDDAPSMFVLAGFHANGLAGFKKDPALAVRMYSAASEAGLASATRVLGLAYLTGNLNLSINESRALKLLHKAAAKFDPVAMVALGEYYLDTDHDAIAAFELFTAAADRQNSDAMLSLGLMYANGTGLEKNNTLALSFLNRAAELGNAGALCYLARAHNEGTTGLEKDNEKSQEYFNQLADLHHPGADAFLALEFARGNIVPRNTRQSETFFKRAAAAAPTTNTLANYAWLLFGEGRVPDALKQLDAATASLDQHDSPGLKTEVWFYTLAFRPQRHDEALRKLASLINEQHAHSEGWDFSRVIRQALRSNPRHPDAKWLPKLADVISGKADASTLNAWPAWSQATQQASVTDADAHN